MSVTVETKAQLEQAKTAGEMEIIVQGKLADKLKKSKKVALLSGVSLVILLAAAGGATVTAPVTGGASYFIAAPVVAPVAAYTGLEVAAIITAISLGIGLIIALFKEYEEVGYSKGRLVLRKKQRN